MTTYQAYDAGLPCKNPSCASHGKPHPNCRCYDGNMAEGGEVKSFCASNKPHKKECKYYAEGTPEGPIPAPTPTPEPGALPSFDQTEPIETSAEPLPAFEDTEPLQESEELPAWEKTTGEHGSIGQQILTGVEGAAQGVAGPLATGAELLLSKAGVPGLTEEDIKGRQAENPTIHSLAEAGGFAGSMLTGVGEAALVGKAALKAAQLAKIGEATSVAAKLGSGALKGAIEGGLFQTGDEVSKAMLGQGDPNEGAAGKLADAGSNILTTGVGGGVLGTLGGAASKLLSKAAESKIGTYLHSWLAGVGETAKGIDPEHSLAKWSNEKAYKNGIKFWDNNIASKALSLGTLGSATSDILRSVHDDDIEGGLEKAIRDLSLGVGAILGIKALRGPGSATLLKLISSGDMSPRSLFEGLNYADQVNRGAQKMSRGVEGLFKIGGQQLFNASDLSKKREKLDEWIQNGGNEQHIQESIYDNNGADPAQGFAKGGDVKKAKKEPDRVAPLLSDNDPIANHYPEQNILLNAAKGRISNYLKDLRPQENQPKLAFDREPDQRQKKKSYNKALDIAIQPLSILDKIHKGTIETEDVTHFKNLYPEIDNVLQRKITEQIVKSQMSGKKPSYKVRQGMSLLIGIPLSGEMSPQNMMAAQATFQNKQAQQPGGQPQKKLSAISKSYESNLTANEASAARQQRQS